MKQFTIALASPDKPLLTNPADVKAGISQIMNTAIVPNGWFRKLCHFNTGRFLHGHHNREGLDLVLLSFFSTGQDKVHHSVVARGNLIVYDSNVDAAAPDEPGFTYSNPTLDEHHYNVTRTHTKSGDSRPARMNVLSRTPISDLEVRRA